MFLVDMLEFVVMTQHNITSKICVVYVIVESVVMSFHDVKPMGYSAPYHAAIAVFFFSYRSHIAKR